MANYTKITDFALKDSLPSGDTNKIIRGSEFETEFDNIATAIASKLDSGSLTSDLVTYSPNGTGAVDTTVETKLRESVSVKDFGATGDGVTDDTAAIQSGITFVSGNGKALYVPAGNYLLSATVDIPSNVTMYGDGIKSRLFRDTGVAAFDMLEIKGSAHVILRDFLIDGVSKLDRSVLTNRYCGIRVYQAAPEIFTTGVGQADFVYSFDSPSQDSDLAVYINNSSSPQTLTTDYTVNLITKTVSFVPGQEPLTGDTVIIANLASVDPQPNDIEIHGVHINTTTSGEQQAEGNRAALLLEDCNDVRVSRCKFYDNRGAGIIVSQIGSAASVFRTDPPYQTKDIQITQCWGVGEQATGDPDPFGSFIAGNQFENMVVSDCIADGFGFANFSLNGQKQTIQNCISINSNSTGITLGHPTRGSRAAEVVCNGNICEGNGLAGISISSAENVTVSNNVLRSNCEKPVVPDGSVEGQIEIRHNSNYVTNEAKKISITDNVIEGNKTALTPDGGYGILTECGTDLFISGNSIYNCQKRGIQLFELDASETMNVLVTNNLLKDNGSSTQPAIEANSDSGASRGFINAVCINNTIESSDIATNQGCGITAVGDQATIKVHENYFSNNYVNVKNEDFGSRSGKALNAFTSGTLISADVSKGATTTVNIRDFYALTSDGTDWSPAFQAAIDALAVNDDTFTGGVIFVPRGNYPISSTITVDTTIAGDNSATSISIHGEGMHNTRITCSPGFTGTVAMDVTQATYCSFKDFHLYGNNPSNCDNGLRFFRGSEVQVERVFCQRFNQSGFLVERCFMMTFEQCRAKSCLTNFNFASDFGVGVGGYNTSIDCRNCYSVDPLTDGVGFHINDMVYSTFTACGSDMSNGIVADRGNYGYRISNINSTSFNNCGAEGAGRASFFFEASSALDAVHFMDGLRCELNGCFSTGANAKGGVYASIYSAMPTTSVIDVTVKNFYENDVNGLRSFDNTGLTEDQKFEFKNCRFVNSLDGSAPTFTPSTVLRKDSVSVTAANTPVIDLASVFESLNAYSGVLHITAQNGTPASTAARNTTGYVLLVTKGTAGSGVVEIAKNGLTTGGSGSHPSFTWTLDTTNNQLEASPIGSTSGTFFFYVTHLGALEIS